MALMKMVIPSKKNKEEKEMGQLEIIDILCDVTSKMSALICDMYTQLEQANVEKEVLTKIQSRQKECDDAMNAAEYKLRRRGQ